MLRRLQLGALALGLVVAALSTGAPYLFFLLYLAIVVVGGAYLLARFGLADLEAGYVLDRQQAEVGQTLRVTYTVRNLSRIPKLWLEAYNPSTLPVPLPGRALSLGPRGERSWAAHVRLTRRGQYRVDALTLRTADPFGFFESSATVGTPTSLLVHPRVEAIPGWRLAPAQIEGAHAHPVRTAQTTPHATGIRPYEPGDSYNRIHWRTSARTGELQVKEFDLEQTADLWLYVDLDRSAHAGEGDESTIEYAVRVAAAVGAQALIENRTLGLTANGGRHVVLQPDRGRRQYLKMLQLLAAVQPDGSQPLLDVLIEALPRLRRGMTAVVVTSSTSTDWVKPLSSLRGRGVSTMVVLLDAHAFAQLATEVPDAAAEDAGRRALRAVRHALAEHDLPVVTVGPGRTLAEQLVTARGSRVAVR
ncbi:MAG TPA: DUF58 domain-containing protein [Candidatus Limnocylindrales bacterium]|nr:DUF58 domain-containing protein [Candidatus Limnocylindrales bacterium]